MYKQFNFLLALLLIACCLENCSSEAASELSENETGEVITDTTRAELPIVESIQRNRLTEYLNSEIDLSEMKKDIGFLSMGWSIDSDYLPEIPIGSQQYNYGAVGGLILDPKINISPSIEELKTSGYKFISIITYKPWSTPQEKFYSNNNETVIGFETSVQYERLDSLNFVGFSGDSLINLFGQPDTIINECWTYKSANKVLSLNIKQDKVDWVKFYHLNDSTFNLKNYPEGLFSWTNK